MPVFWHLDPIWRNQVIVSALLLLFCPWPLIPIIYVGLLCAGSNDWDEDKLGLTFEEWTEEYFSYYGYGAEEVEIALRGHEDYRNGYLKLRETGRKAYRSPAYKEGLEFMRQGKRPDKVPTWYDVDNLDLPHQHIGEGYEILQEIMDKAMDDWETVVPVIVEEADVFFESLDYWYQKQLLLENNSFVKELRMRNTLRNQKSPHKKVSSYYLRSHLGIWLSAMPFYERVSYTIKADRLLAKRFTKKPLANTLIL